MDLRIPKSKTTVNVVRFSHQFVSYTVTGEPGATVPGGLCSDRRSSGLRSADTASYMYLHVDST